MGRVETDDSIEGIENAESKSTKSDYSITIPFPSNAPDWVHLFSTSPDFKLVSMSKFIKDEIEYKTMKTGHDLEKSLTGNNIFALIQTISTTIAEWNSGHIISVVTPKSKHNPLLREWLEYTFGRADNKLITHKSNSESKADLTPILDTMSISTSDLKKDVSDSKSEDSVAKRFFHFIILVLKET